MQTFRLSETIDRGLVDALLTSLVLEPAQFLLCSEIKYFRQPNLKKISIGYVASASQEIFLNCFIRYSTARKM